MHCKIRKDAWWFGEAQGRVVVTCETSASAELEQFLSESGLAFEKIGLVTSGRVLLEGNSWGDINEWKNIYDTSIENILKASVNTTESLLPV